MKTPRMTTLLVASLVGLSTAAAGQRRVAILVAHPFGGEGLVPLRYSANDLDRIGEVLRDIGDFDRRDTTVLFGESAEDVIDAFADARERIAQYNEESGDGTLFVFYYSGHAKDGDLRLGETRLPLVELKKLVDSTGATVRVAFLDACRSGSITRLKGAVKGEPIGLAVEDAAAQAGHVLITASSANEDAQESDDIQGSFFTHYLTSALRGASDDNGDGNITLAEAYSFAYANTVARTVGTSGGTQHPTFRFDLRGAGNVVLTRPGRPTSAIDFPPALGGHFVVFDARRRVVVAEFDKSADKATQLAVSPGHYVIKKRETDHLRMQRLWVQKGRAVTVDPDEMEKVAFEDDYAKGAVVTTEEIRYGKLGFRLSAGFAGQAFLSTPARDGYFPSLGLLHLALDLDNTLRPGFGLRVDLGLGGSGARTLDLSDDYLGELSYEVEVSEMTLGIALTGTWKLTDWLCVGGQGRLGFISVTRTFNGVDVPKQGFSTLTPGIGAELDVALLSWLSAGLRTRLHYMFFNVDESMSLLYLDAGIVLSAVFR